MGRSEDYREKAREAEAFARKLSLRPERDQYLRIAKTWRDLAEAAEAEERKAAADES